MSRQAAMRAQTDQQIAAAREARVKGGAWVGLCAALAGDFAGGVREEFGDDAPLAGRVMSAVAAQLNEFAKDLLDSGLDPAKLPMLLDVLALAGEELCREGTTGA
jgi:hypothetical protein